MIQSEIDAAYRQVMEKGDLILRGQLKRFEENQRPCGDEIRRGAEQWA
jgi:hypothetical protein